MSARAGAPITLFYDDCCGFCMWMIALVLRLDREGVVRTQAIQSPHGTAVLGDLPPDVRLASWHMIDAAGTRWSGGAVFAPLASRLPALRWAARPIARVPRIADLAYGLAAAQRRRLSAFVPAGAKHRAADAVRRHTAESGRAQN